MFNRNKLNEELLSIAMSLRGLEFLVSDRQAKQVLQRQEDRLLMLRDQISKDNSNGHEKK